jgi:hypothetical protein
MSAFHISTLTDIQKSIAQRTLSSWGFYYILGDALLNRKPISTVRMGDGERILLDACVKASLEERGHLPVDSYDQAWRERMGIEGITFNDLYRRIRRAGEECSHFGPNISGLTQDYYSVYSYFSPRQQYVDNFWVNAWNSQAKAELYKAAGSILFFHRNQGTGDALQRRCKELLNVDVTFVQLDSWQKSQQAINRAISHPAPLVLFSGGPASKYISPEIAAHAPKVVLDLGNSVDQWTLSDL